MTSREASVFMNAVTRKHLPRYVSKAKFRYKTVA